MMCPQMLGYASTNALTEFACNICTANTPISNGKPVLWSDFNSCVSLG
ncbi:hypothetical protein MHK07_01400 [Moraxella nonliquefaciens]|nr:hypothetical protein [Moraxella nonliquefaciens]